MPRFLTVPDRVTALDPNTGKAMDTEVSFADACKMATTGMTVRSNMDVLSLIDLRAKLTSADVGAVVELSEAEWEALSAEFKGGKNFGPAYLFVSEPHVRAVLNAAIARPNP